MRAAADSDEAPESGRDGAEAPEDVRSAALAPGETPGSETNDLGDDAHAPSADLTTEDDQAQGVQVRESSSLKRSAAPSSTAATVMNQPALSAAAITAARQEAKESELDNASVSTPETEPDDWFSDDRGVILPIDDDVYADLDEDDDTPFGNHKTSPMVFLGAAAAVLTLGVILWLVIAPTTPPPPSPTAVGPNSADDPQWKQSAGLRAEKKGRVTTGPINPATTATADAGPAPVNAASADATSAPDVQANVDATTATDTPSGPETTAATDTSVAADAPPANTGSLKVIEAKPAKPVVNKRAQAQESYALGSQAEARGDLAKAAEHYSMAWGLDADYTAARDAIRRVKKKQREQIAAKKDPPKKDPPKKDPPKKDPPKKDPPKKDPPKVDTKKDPPVASGNNKAESARLLKLGMGAYKNGRYALAAKYFSKAKKLDSSNLLARKYLQQAQRQMPPK